MTNRLAQETSPYLLQHKDNPVDWQPWEDEALETASREDKPILLSVGYAACHWCHVMEHESFEDPSTAAIMNEHFVCIKVDREERPDLDAIYMEAVQAMTGHGGWPMTVFLTPEGVPFYGGTYFPPEDRHGLPSFRRLLAAVAETWRERRDEIEQQGRHLLEHIGQTIKPAAATDDIGEDVLQNALEALRSSFDHSHGGFGAAPKFPQPMTIDLLLRLEQRGHEEAGDMAATTLDAMVAGGIFDQLRGGFARYSVDRYWIVPHFEKMLYDNAQLIRTYARSWLARGSDRHREVTEMTVGWLLDEMRDPAGGFWSSLDADSEGEEGKFYIWSLDEVRAAAGPDSDAAVTHWGITADGNFEGHNIPVYAAEPHDPSAVARARARLLEARSMRVRPDADTKVITAWNAMTVAGLAEAGAAFGRDDWVDVAEEAMQFILGTLRVRDRLMRTYSSERASVRHLGYSEDYAAVLEACLTLFEVAHGAEWLEEARWTADEAIRLFWDPETSTFFTTGTDAPALVTRPKDLFDNAVPSANSVMALELQRLALLTGDDSYGERALGPLRLLGRAASRSPQAFGRLLQAVDFHTARPAEIVIVGRPDAPDTAELVAAVHSRFLPNKVLIVADQDDGRLAKQVPLLEGRIDHSERATAYVCHEGYCELPVHDRDALLQLL